jgi:hypothetical protein
LFQKEQQIAQMDIIYSRALLTIVALSGRYGDLRLPGVRGATREPAILVAELGGGLRLVSRAPGVDILTANSVYDSRAWTFQEKLLSKRCLFFTERQVFLQCASYTFREDESILGPPEESSLHRAVAGLLSMLTELGPLRVYFHLVHDYTNRDLTNPGDILYAFEGIAKALETSIESKFVEGLPIHKLNEALLWTPQSRVWKRSIFSAASTSIYPSQATLLSEFPILQPFLPEIVIAHDFQLGLGRIGPGKSAMSGRTVLRIPHIDSNH